MDNYRDKKIEFKIKYDGDIVEEHAISIRTLGNTLPHFQRALDKAVIFDRDGKYKRGHGIGRAEYLDANLMLQVIEEGSVILPLIGKIKESAVGFFNWALEEPYHKAVYGDMGLNREAQIKTYKTRLINGDIEEKTQKHLMQRASRENKNYARSAMLNDLNKMFSVVRSAGDHEIHIQIEKPGYEAIYKFDRNIAKNFDKIVDTPLPTEPVIYRGKYKGYKQVSGEDLKFEVYVFSTYSDQIVNIYVSGMDDLSNFTSLKHNEEIYFWASPLQKYGAFDAYNGSAVFVDVVKYNASSENS